MTNLPGDQIPDDALPEGGSSVPAQDAEEGLADVWCRHDVRWTYDGTAGGYVCTQDGHNDVDDEGEQIPAATACAVEDGTVYAYQPSTNAAVWEVLQRQAAEERAAAIEARVGRMLG